MKKKIIGILFCMLVIGAPSLAIADWKVGDDHIMHSPQLPDPYGLDIDFHDWWLADDWYSNIQHNVTDIHFWYSWKDDVVQNIPWIKVSIWSNNIGPPSTPYQELWNRNFSEDEFIIKGPFTGGSQGWFQPPTFYIPNNHEKYYQINIINIPDPFEQQVGEMYWLVIHMPYYPNPGVGWKTSLNHFADNAVYGTPTTGWTPLWDPRTPGQKIDFAFVITGKEPILPDIDFDGALEWEMVRPGSIVFGNFAIGNIGGSGSMLDWKVISWPTWGNWTFTPENGTHLPAGNWITVNVTVTAPLNKNKAFTGNVKVVNLDNSSDYCEINVYLKTPKNLDLRFLLFFRNFFERFPHAFPILRYLMGY